MMSWLELGGMAGAIVSIWTLIGKVVHLITTIQGLIQQIGTIQESLINHQEMIVTTQALAQKNARSIHAVQAHEQFLEKTMQDLRACIGRSS